MLVLVRAVCCAVVLALSAREVACAEVPSACPIVMLGWQDRAPRGSFYLTLDVNGRLIDERGTRITQDLLTSIMREARDKSRKQGRLNVVVSIAAPAKTPVSMLRDLLRKMVEDAGPTNNYRIYVRDVLP